MHIFYHVEQGEKEHPPLAAPQVHLTSSTAWVTTKGRFVAQDITHDELEWECEP